MPQYPLAFQTKNSVLGFADAQSALWVAQRHGPQYAAGAALSQFVGANSLATPVTTSIGLATTYVGLCLSNPAASTKNLYLMNISAAFQVAPSTITTLSLIGGYSAAGIVTHTTALTPLSTSIGNALVPQGLVDSACTLVGTPAYYRILGQAPTATTSTFVNVSTDGGIVIPPGGYVAIGTNIAGPASGFVGSFLWEEE